MNGFVYYIPIFTTLFCAYFFIEIAKHWAQKKNAWYLLWWTVGVFCYGLGTLVESAVTLFGWNVILFKSWYVFGAFLGGVPLAQGTVHLLLGKKFAKYSSIVLISVLIISAFLVSASPINHNLVVDHHLSGDVLGWSWIRLITPFINIYAFIFLVGGAIYSAYKYFKQEGTKARFIGNVLIAIGGILPGIGGSFSKFGQTEVLYVTEFLGILLIYFGYRTIKNRSSSPAVVYPSA